MNVALDVLLLIDLCSCRVLIFMAAQWTLHFWLLGARGGAQPQSRRVKYPRKARLSVYLFLHHENGKKSLCYGRT
jgi:hypothetical protein